MTITPADLAVGQVWRDIYGCTREIVAIIEDSAIYARRMPSGAFSESHDRTIERMARDANEFSWTLVTPAPSPIPNPAALKDLYEALRFFVAEHNEVADTMASPMFDGAFTRPDGGYTCGCPACEKAIAAIRKAGGDA